MNLMLCPLFMDHPTPDLIKTVFCGCTKYVCAIVNRADSLSLPGCISDEQLIS